MTQSAAVAMNAIKYRFIVLFSQSKFSSIAGKTTTDREARGQIDLNKSLRLFHGKCKRGRRNRH